MIRPGTDGVVAGSTQQLQNGQQYGADKPIGLEEEEEYPSGVQVLQFEEDVVNVIVTVQGRDVEWPRTSTIAGIGTSNPLLKIGETTLEGKAEPIVGTTMVFKAPPAGDKGQTPLQVEGCSTMIINFKSGATGVKRPRR